MLTWDAIEAAFARLLESVQSNPALAEELARSRREFFSAREADGPEAERRHREWFLLERPSQALSGVPAPLLEGDWAGGDAELSTALLHSLPGVFAVTSLVPGEGLWVHDLATQGEHPVVESDASVELQPDDVLVGRMFPVGGGLFRLSPAMAWFRSPKLVAALRADFERQRAARRGVLRIAQLELEQLFHGAETVPGAVADSPRAEPASDLPQVRRASREGLAALGLADEVVARVLQRVRREAKHGHARAVTEVLNGLAFDTDVDLKTAQRILVELWHAERTSQAAPGSRERELGDARAALASFDRGRAEGQDLEKLFRKLERDLGVDDDDSDEDDADDVVPDFPGVVGAMVDEFLWDVERERGPAPARRWSALRRLGEYGRDIGLFEELTPAHLLDFTGRWLLDEAAIGDEQEVRALLEALEGFCRWCEESHALPLWTGFGPQLGRIAQELPRLAALRRELANGAALPGAFRVVRIEPDAAVVVDRAQEMRVAITPAQRRHLRDGDVVRVTGPAAAPALAAAYPGELLELFS